MSAPDVTASSYRVGTSVSSVERLLEARTAAEDAIARVGEVFIARTRIDGPVEVVGVSPGPPTAGDAMTFVARTHDAALGSVIVPRATVVQIADLVIGGRGVPDDRMPTPLEIDLFSTRLVEPIGALIDAVAPGRPTIVALDHGELPSPARSLVIELALTHAGASTALVVEVLTHHVPDDDGESDAAAIERVCSDVPVELSVRFTPVQVPAGDIAELRPGDVIRLDHELSKPLVGVVDGRPVVTARVGVSNRRVAIEVVDLVEESA